MPSPTAIFLALLVVGAAVWTVRRVQRVASRRRVGSEGVDREVLEAAEEEVRELDAFSTPEDADDELPDWGPGAPKT